MSKYTFAKKTYCAKDVEQIRVIFKNNDFFEFAKSEIVDINIAKLYDNLVCEEGGFAPVVCEGSITINVSKRHHKLQSFHVCDYKEYVKNKLKYIENRFVNEGGIHKVWLFDDNNWHDVLLGDVVATMQGQRLVLTFKNNETYGTNNSKQHCINLAEIRKGDIFKIHLGFENCDGFDVYQDEIKSLQLNFCQELEWGSGALRRKIDSGILKIKLDDYYNDAREKYILASDDDDVITTKMLNDRLCEKEYEFTDICHLYITYGYFGYGEHREETVEVDDIRDPGELEKLIDQFCDQETDVIDEYELFKDCDYNAYHVSGDVTRQKDGTMVIRFGNKDGRIKL